MNNIYDFIFYPSLILRTPAYSYQNYDDQEIQKLLEEPFFRSAIYLGSSSLYNALKKKNFNYKELSSKEANGLRRYFNRVCFRPTPFGLFAGFSVVQWGHDNPLLQLGKNITAHVNFSYRYSILLAREMLNEIPSLNQTVIASNTLYKVGKEYRYIRYIEDEDTGNRNFFIDSFAETDPMGEILFYNREKRTIKELSAFISSEFDASEEESLSFIQQLIEKQIILPILTPNITGKDYLARVNALAEKVSEDDIGCLKAVRRKVNTLEDLSQRINRIDIGEELSDFYPKQEKVAGARQNILYVNLEKPCIKGILDASYQKKILEGLYCTDKLLPNSQKEELEEFATVFTRKFGKRMIPLLYALDPEVGVGYASLADNYTSSTLLSDIQIEYHIKGVPVVEWTPAHKLLMNKWGSISSNKNSVSPIIIEKEDLEKLPYPYEDYPFTPSLSILFRIMDDKVYIEQAGGTSAISLSGRFTPFNEPILKMTKDIAQKEAAANPDVIFAEITHICNMHTANIDRREAIREYEIPLMSVSCQSDSFKIPPDDLWVNVQEDQIFLWSERLQKRIIPRLSSAFNYTRSSFPAFRFLCDLQNQGIKTNCRFDLSSFFPDLDFYPRVQYKQAILSLATWNVKREKWQHILQQRSKDHQVADLKHLVYEMHLPRYISINESDNQIILDCRKNIDLGILLKAAKNKEIMIIKEFPFLNMKKSIVNDELYRPFINQFVASLYHTEKVYNPSLSSPYPFKNGQLKRRKYSSGSEWLYFKIYCHPSRSNELLIKEILPLSQQWELEGILKQWFFVRFSDPEYHLRIRFNINPDRIQKIISDFTEKCSILINYGIISNFQIAVYERELERYTPELIDKVENVFCSSTMLIIEYLKKEANDILNLNYCNIAFVHIEALLNTFGFSLPDKIELFYQLYHSFYGEFKQSNDLRNKLRKKFRELRSSLRSDISENVENPNLPDTLLIEKIDKFKKAQVSLIKKMNEWPTAQRNRLTGDIVHMHLNRLFTDRQRKQEVILYYCLWKYYHSEQARGMQKIKSYAYF